MPYIYKITNNLNQKIYIGKTLQNNINKRWMEHCRDYKKNRNKNRPLYSAIRKYGVDSFELSVVEECLDLEIDQREKHWIQYYRSFKYGYNATVGGDGKQYADYDLFFKLFKQGKNITEISGITKFCIDTVSLGLSLRNISDEEKQLRGKECLHKTVVQIDKKNNEIINVFSSIGKAYIFLNKPQSGHISAVCKGKRNSAYGYKWKYM